MTGRSRTRQSTTLITPPWSDALQRRNEDVPGLTLLAHADPRRVGEQLALPALAAGGEVRLARNEPVFKAPRRGEARPLGDRSISRRPIRLLPGDEPGAVALDVATSSTALTADGERRRDRVR